MTLIVLPDGQLLRTEDYFLKLCLKIKSMYLFTHNFLSGKHMDKKYFSSIGTFMFRCCYEYTSGNPYGQSNKFSFKH